MTETFASEHYDRIRAGCQASADVIVPELYDRYEPRTVLDVGCGEGWFASRFLEEGTETAIGVDLERPEGCALESFIALDLASKRIRFKADLAICLETAEHLPPRCGPGLVADLCKSAPIVVFSAAVPGQTGHGHVNCRPASYWAGLFAKHDRFVSTWLRDLIWDDERVEPWYRQNLLIFDDVSDYSTRTEPLDVIHPEILSWYTP